MHPRWFQVERPSKIRLTEAHHLLEHWRHCMAQGLTGLIWVPSSPLFDDQGDAPNHGQQHQQPIDNLQDDSDEESFVLPQSDEIEEGEYESNDDAQHQYRSSHDSPPIGRCHGGHYGGWWCIPFTWTFLLWVCCSRLWLMTHIIFHL